MTTALILLLTNALVFGAGMLAYRNNAKKAAKLEAKAKTIVDVVKD